MTFRPSKATKPLYAALAIMLLLLALSFIGPVTSVYSQVGLSIATLLVAIPLLFRANAEKNSGGAYTPSVSNDAERVLRLEAIQSRIFSNAAVGIALVAPEGKPEITNEYFQQLLGYSNAELSSMHFSEFTHPEDAEVDLHLYQELLDAKRDDYQMEKRYIRKDGNVVWVHLSVSLSGSPTQPDTRAIAIVEDISASKQMEAILASNERTMQLFVEHTPAAVAMFDNDMRYMLVSKRWITDYNLQEQDIIGRTHYEVFPEIEGIEEWKSDHQRVLSGEIIKNDQDGFEREDGSMDWVRYELHPWRDRNGVIGGLIMFTEVITEKVNLQLAVEAHKERLSTIFDNIKDIVSLHDSNGLYLELSPSVKHITGYEPEELIGKSPFDFWHPEDVEKLKGEAAAVSFEMQLVGTEIEYRYRHRDGHYLWLQSHFERINVDGRDLEYASSSRDITESYKVRTELNKSLDALGRSNQELKTFAYVASHDLQEPLRVITSYLQLLQRRFSESIDEKAEQYIEHTVDAAGRMKTLINDLLTLSRIETTKLSAEEVDPQKVIQDVEYDMQLKINETQAQIDVSDLPKVKVDRGQLRQLLQNLIANSIKFQSEGSVPQVKISARVSKGMAEFKVEDNGIGIEAEFHSRIFTIFQRLHSRTAYAGTGIGLAIAKKIVERHGGEIWIEEKDTPGVTFKFTLPTC